MLRVQDEWVSTVLPGLTARQLWAPLHALHPVAEQQYVCILCVYIFFYLGIYIDISLPALK